MPPRKTKSTVKAPAKNNPFRLTHIPLLSWVAFWVCISATLVLISATFTSALSFAQTPEENADTVVALQQLGDALEKKADEMTGGATQPKGRIMTEGLVTAACDMTWATSTNVISVSHLEARTNVRMSLPYSFDWGNEQYVLTPVRAGDPSNAPSLEFGPIYVQEDSCLGRRDSEITIMDPGSNPSEVRRSLSPATVRERSLGGVTVLSYSLPTDKVWPNRWHVFGRTHTYMIASHGWLTDAEAVKIIQSLRVEN